MQCSGALWLWLWSLSAAVCPYDMYQCDDGQCVMAWCVVVVVVVVVGSGVSVRHVPVR